MPIKKKLFSFSSHKYLISQNTIKTKQTNKATHKSQPCAHNTSYIATKYAGNYAIYDVHMPKTCRHSFRSEHALSLRKTCEQATKTCTYNNMICKCNLFLLTAIK